VSDAERSVRSARWFASVRTAFSDRMVVVVGASAVVVYLGTLWNGHALDDMIVIVRNPVIHSLSGLWRAFTQAYLGGQMYRPLAIASYVADWPWHSAAWYHAVNVLWHAAASVLTAVLARRWVGERGALAAGLLFAVHPVHVEAVANIVGRDELMAACFAVLAVYAALVRGSVGWSAAALSLGLLCKENAAVVPGLIVWGWVLGIGTERPPRRRITQFVGSWVVIAVLYGVVRWAVLRGNEDHGLAPVLVGQSGLTVRLTALAALADVTRLLVFPLKLRIDYSPDERTAVTSWGDGRVALGALCVVLLVTLIVAAWRRGRRVEAFGLGWTAIALSPVANLLFPTGILVAERTLYLPSVGLVLAAGSWFARWSVPRAWLVAGAVLVAAGVRTATRVPVWRTTYTAVLSILEDSPRSYVGPMRMAGAYLDQHQSERALDAARQALAIYRGDLTIYMSGAVAAFAAGRPATADSLLAELERSCPTCPGKYYHTESEVLRRIGYPAEADSLDARVR